MKHILQKIWSGWKSIAHKIARVQTVILLTLFYFLILTPMGFLFRLFRWDPLQSRSRNMGKETNWRNADKGEPDLESMRRQS